MNHTFDVFISGCGPVGLLGPTQQSRAFGITPHTMEIFQHHGLTYRILQQSIACRGGTLFLNGKDMGDLHFDEFDAVFPQLTFLSQSKVEAILVDEIEKIHGKIHWNTELIEYEQQKDCIVAQVKDHTSGKTFEVAAQYIIGSDGCHSSIRKQNPTWTYEGNSIQSNFALADFVLEGADISRIRNRQVVFYHSKGASVLIPLPHEDDGDSVTMRMVSNLGTYATDHGAKVTHGTDNPREELTLDQVKDLMDERMNNLQVSIKRPIWLTFFNVNERMANGFRRGRAFIMGDAAHCHSPAGGQGMNIGLQDAENLAWKLSLALNDESSDSEKLLDSYSIEREPIVRSVVDATGILTRVAMSNSFVMSLARYAGLAVAYAVPPVRRILVNRILQLDFTLGDSPIIAPPKPNERFLEQGGHSLKETRALLSKDVTIAVERKTIFEILEKWNNKHAVFWMITRQTWQQEPDVKLTNAFIDGISRYNSCRGFVFQSTTQFATFDDFNSTTQHKVVDYWIDTHAISSADSLTSKLGLTAHLTDSKSKIPPAALVILRPDRYIAYSSLVSTQLELDQAFTFMDSYLLQNQ
ncbi:FAD binding domain-domain-containing protein [Absidia repens]|uniref:FAD binding domain-domain-containing protein n=1 Tax=Absidia repens TaxID=90262 RepID=A0A1X2IME7_9FUNG|nr:FAD binding domain-domain-containing protein [Absidia repens]